MQDNTRERDLDTLLTLLTKENKNLSSIDDIKSDINYIFNYLEQNLNKYNKDYIDSVKKNIRTKDVKDKIISMIIINYLLFNRITRRIQVISLLLIIKNNIKNINGLIEEIKTGEGKSTIIMFLATLKALEGKKVDILTSSPVLAERDSKMNQKFFEAFGLTCDYCHEDEENKNENLTYNNYNSDIVYGNVLSFAGDYLKTSFIGTKGRGNREFDVIIIDEIDNICLDNIMNQTQLVDNFKGYKLLEYIYFYIYYNLQQISIGYRLNNDISFIRNNKNNIIKKLLIIFNEFFDNNLKDPKIKFPPHLHDFIQKRKKDWCICAFDALYNYKINKHYVIAYDEDFKFKTIKPIDFSNTGIIEDKSVWSGLHQFLEIKHNLRLTEENLNSCFISNLCYIRLYKEKYGLTGTVGSEKTQEALKSIYDLDVIFIPSFRESKYQFNYKTDYFCDANKENFYENVSTEIYKKYNENRAILVIVKFIDQVNKIKQKIENLTFINKNDIIIYDRNDYPEQSIFLQSEIGPKKVILSTNLCGRGTDIRITKECEKNGGLFVILTFQADSERIEKQALGRAARKGENGSGKIMLNGIYSSYEKVKNERDSIENQKFNYLMKTFKQRTIFFQNLFNKFCIELNNLKKRPNISKNQIMDIKERWGLFLIQNDLDKLEEQDCLQQISSNNNSKKENNFAKINAEIIKCGIDPKYQKIQEAFDIFIRDIFYNNSEYEYKNPFQMITDFEDKNLEKAQDMCESLSLGAYYYQIYKKIIGYKIKIESSSLLKIIDSFKKLEKKVKSLILQYLTYEELIEKIEYSGQMKDLFKQNEEKINYLKNFIQNLEDNIKFIQNISINKKYIFTADITLKFNEIQCEHEDIKKYFLDFGLFNTFTMQLNDSCNII